AAMEDEELNHIIGAHRLLQQTELQADLLNEMRKLVAALSRIPSEQRTVQAGSLLANEKPVYHYTVQVAGDVDGSIIIGDHNNVVQIVINQYISQHPSADNDPVILRRHLHAYLTWLMTERQNLSMRAISSGKTTGEEAPPELSAVYVALNTRQSKRARDSEPLSALAALAYHRQIVLLGDPGSGKSTFVNHLAYCLAAHAQNPNARWLAKLPDWPQQEADRLPILVVLRDFARWLPNPLPAKANVTHLWDFIVETLQDQKLDDAVPLIETALINGRALLLLDGLDEVTNMQQRRFVRDAVEAFSGRYKQNFLLVACRILSYKEPDEAKEEPDLRLSPRFRSFTLAEFNQEQRDSFVHAWYRELKNKGHLPGLDETILSSDLQRAIRRSDLERVAGNPLLLTVMAMVHVEKGELPNSRALLYDETIDLLLSRWETTKDAATVAPLRQLLKSANRTEADLTTRLAAVAFTVHTQAGSEAANDEKKVADISETYLCSELSRLHKKDLGWGQKLLEVIKERAGLLIERSPGQFAFPHRTFQEYLAGVYLGTQLDFADQAQSWAEKDVGWWSMILFAVEHLVYVQKRPLDALNLISKLCPQANPESLTDWRFVWLAGEALVSLGRERAEDSEWGVELTGRVRQRLDALLATGQLRPIERAAAGRALAQLGDPRPGIGTNLRPDGLVLPDIQWGEIVPARTYKFGNNAFEIKGPYQLSRYPVTYAQFDCFVQAGDFDDPRWWQDMPAEEEAYGTTYKLREISEQAFPYANHPRERVSWYQAMA
ncbi:MAG: NACHT domain-containing protein, partial [Caldilineaceae bacterium]|nr:NACHT domain-containing protein [Caldilineaceae bacterium]